jgi:hypothetical protein
MFGVELSHTTGIMADTTIPLSRTGLEAMTDAEKFLADELAAVYKVLKAADIHLEGYRNAFTAFELLHPESKEILDAFLNAATQPQTLREAMTEKYSLILETSFRKCRDGLPLEIQEQLERL